MIGDNIKSRLFLNGRMRQQIIGMRKILSDYPKSEYAKVVYQSLNKKFWYGSKKVTYHEIFTKAWEKIFKNKIPDIIEIGDLMFMNEDAFKIEYTDIFLAAGLIDKSNFNEEQIIASKVLSLLSYEGSYEDGNVKLREDDIVIDAGANMGLFSLFCTLKKIRKVFAFEPQKSAIEKLEKNLLLNDTKGIVEIIPFGISDKTADYELYHSYNGIEAASIVLKRNADNDTETIHCVDLDNWLKESNIPRIDFIKADIEGAERYLLLGSTEILKKFAPRLAICTYHLPDDPSVLKKIIMKANPDYVIRQNKYKLFAHVPEK